MHPKFTLESFLISLGFLNTRNIIVIQNRLLLFWSTNQQTGVQWHETPISFVAKVNTFFSRKIYIVLREADCRLVLLHGNIRHWPLLT